MSALLRAGVIALAICVAPSAFAQALPDSVRAAGVTVAQWQAVQDEVRRAASARGASERALQAVAERVSVNLVHNGRIDLDQLLRSIDERAQQVADLQSQLAAMERADDPAVAALLTQARSAINAGDLANGDQFLARAAQSDLADIARDRARLASRQTRAADTIGERGRLASINADYLGAAALYALAAGTAPESDAQARWQYRMYQADALRRRGELFGEPAPLREAVRLYREAVQSLAPRTARPTDWATTQSKLSDVLRILGERGDEHSMLEAITASRAALEVDTREDNPMDWARDQGNLGNALSVLGEHGDDQALRDAIAAYRLALEVDTQASNPDDWATLQNDMGDALRILGERGDSLAFGEAITALRAALEVRTRADDPFDWAETQNNLGITLGALGMRGGGPNGGLDALRASVLVFVEALDVGTRERSPSTWAKLQNNLSNVYRVLGERGDGPNAGSAALHAALDAARAALQVRTRNASPADWGSSQLNLGSALLDLGQRGDDQALREAIVAYRAALEVFERASNPAGWAAVQRNIALSLWAVVLDGDRSQLEAARAAARAAVDGFQQVGDSNSANLMRPLLAELEAH